MHGVSLAAASLTVRKDAHIEALVGLLDEGSHILEYVCLCRLAIITRIKFVALLEVSMHQGQTHGVAHLDDALLIYS